MEPQGSGSSVPAAALLQAFVHITAPIEGYYFKEEFHNENSEEDS